MRKVIKMQHYQKPKEPGRYKKLTCLTGETKGEAYYIVGNRVVMGRSDKADIRVLDIKSSREHAELTKVGKDLIVTDLNSQNGIIVNELKVKQHTLNVGDKIIIGKTIYRYTEVSVAAPKKELTKTKIDTKQLQNEPEPQKFNIRLVLGAIIFLAIVLFGFEEEGLEPTPIKSGKTDKTKFRIIDEGKKKTKIKKDSEKAKKLNAYIHRGLREFREENYYRAINEFNHALSWVPNDSLAQFYIRKTREALDDKVSEHAINAQRSIESLKYSKAIDFHCSIVRLLQNQKTDPRLKKSVEVVEQLKDKHGIESTSIDECLRLGGVDI